MYSTQKPSGKKSKAQYYLLGPFIQKRSHISNPFIPVRVHSHISNTSWAQAAKAADQIVSMDLVPIHQKKKG